MDTVMMVLIVVQLFCSLVVGIYFFRHIKGQPTKSSWNSNSNKEMEKLRRLRDIHLTEPLSEKTRPETFEEIIGQDKGIKALKAALCGPNPQHVIIYGPPGIGKTAAARLVLEEAKKNIKSPFAEQAKFVELDATILQFDERSIADPLIGSVHDPIYQGAGAYGQAGVPQPKAGAVTKAHGGMLFIDEIGELHPLQMNKLLKVLEDRKVLLTSSYYSAEDKNTPSHIHDIFRNGLPADFRLVGATTRSPEDIPPALRSRCTEIFFRGLTPGEVCKIAANAAKKGGFTFDFDVPDIICAYADNGRDTVNIIQTAGSIALLEERRHIQRDDVKWVIEFGRYAPKLRQKVKEEGSIGAVNGLAIYGSDKGSLLEIEASVTETAAGKGTLTVTGIIEQEELKGRNSTMKRSSTAKASVVNGLTTLNKLYGFCYKDHDIHVNFPGGMPVDGPSAGIAIFTALYSAINKKTVSSKIAMTGEITIQGNVKPVGGVHGKIEAAIEAGAKTVIIPADNWQELFQTYAIEIVPVKHVNQVLHRVFGDEDRAFIQEQYRRKSQDVTSSKEESGIIAADTKEGFGVSQAQG